MEGKRTKEFFLDREVLHELRGQFDEVPPHIRATQTLEAGIGKHAVQRVAELMQESLHLAQCQQGRLLCRRLREIHHHTDMRAVIHPLTIDPLSTILRHPCPTLLAFTRMEIGIEHGEEGAILVKHLVSLHIGMIDGNLLIFLEGDAIKTVCQSEDTIDNFRQFEIRTQHLGIDIVFLQLQLVRIIAEVPGLEFEVFSFQLLRHLLDGCHFLLG